MDEEGPDYHERPVTRYEYNIIKKIFVCSIKLYPGLEESFVNLTRGREIKYEHFVLLLNHFLDDLIVQYTMEYEESYYEEDEEEDE